MEVFFDARKFWREIATGKSDELNKWSLLNSLCLTLDINKIELDFQAQTSPPIFDKEYCQGLVSSFQNNTDTVRNPRREFGDYEQSVLISQISKNRELPRGIHAMIKFNILEEEMRASLPTYVCLHSPLITRGYSGEGAKLGIPSSHAINWMHPDYGLLVKYFAHWKSKHLVV